MDTVVRFDRFEEEKDPRIRVPVQADQARTTPTPSKATFYRRRAVAGGIGLLAAAAVVTGGAKGINRLFGQDGGSRTSSPIVSHYTQKELSELPNKRYVLKPG